MLGFSRKRINGIRRNRAMATISFDCSLEEIIVWGYRGTVANPRIVCIDSFIGLQYNVIVPMLDRRTPWNRRSRACCHPRPTRMS